MNSPIARFKNEYLRRSAKHIGTPPSEKSGGTMMNIKLSFAIICVIIMVSCNNMTISNPNPFYGINVDSLEMPLVNRNTIYVGEGIGNRPLSSQVVSESNEEKYYLLDDNKIFVFNWDDGKLCDSIMLTERESLGNYSGFSVVSKDTILLYNYANKTIQHVNAKGDVLGVITLRENESVNVDIEGLNGTRIQEINQQIVGTGAILGDTRNHRFSEMKASVALSFYHPSVKTLMTYPEIYRKANWGGVYMNMVYHTSAKGRFMFYSFPIDHHVYKVDMDTGETTSFYMGSKYCDEIKSSKSDFMEEFIDKNRRVNYYLHEYSYAMILFDEYREQIIRIAEHPAEKIEDDGTFAKPFSVIVTDLEGKKISESRIFEEAKELNLYNMHITKQGLAISYIQKDENKIVFKCYDLK